MSNEMSNEADQDALQHKFNSVLEQLQTMHSALPESFRLLMPHEMLYALANCMLNDTVVQIVMDLIEIQHHTEKKLLQLRQQTEQSQAVERLEWQERISDPDELQHTLRLVDLKHGRDLTEKDKDAIRTLDKKLVEQQCILANAGVPGFATSDRPNDVMLQMYIVDFILRINSQPNAS